MAFLFMATICGAQQNEKVVVITGKAMSRLSLNVTVSTSIGRLTPPITYKPAIMPDSTFYFKIPIDSAQKISLMNQVFCAEPGDSVHIVLKGSASEVNMQFSGPERHHYTLFYALDRLNDSLKRANSVRFAVDTADTLTQINTLRRIDERYEQVNRFYQNYCGRYPCSQAVKDLAYAEIYYSQLYEKLTTLENTSVAISDKTIYSHFKALSPAFMANDKYIQSWAYLLCLRTYIDKYWAKAGADDSLNDVLIKRYHFIKDQFGGRTREALMSMFFEYYFERGNPEYKEVLMRRYESSTAILGKKNVEDMVSHLNRYKMFEMRLESDTQTSLKDRTGAGKTLGDIIKANKGNIIYIDFWASWCAPCRDEMPAAEKLKQRYAGKPVKFIYLSKDQDEKAWRTAFDELKMDKADSFLLQNNTIEDFSRKINLLYIPRYILIDRDGKIVDGDAPRPGDVQLIMKMEALL